jgi:anti-sigma B factor antagonist
MLEDVKPAARVDGDTATVRFAGELDVEMADEMRTRLDEALRRPGVTTILVDLSGAEFVDSTGLGALVAAYNKATAAGQVLRVVDIPSRVERLFAITGTLTLLTGAPTNS